MFRQDYWDAREKEQALSAALDMLGPELERPTEKGELDAVYGLLEEVLEAPGTKRPVRGRVAKASSGVKAAEDAAARSRRLPGRVVHDMVQGRAYHHGREIDIEAWKQGKLVEVTRQ